MKRASIPGPMRRLGRMPERTIWCMICGRPLRPGEDFAPWRIRVLQRSPRYLFTIYTICPAHYGDDPAGHGCPTDGRDDRDGNGPQRAGRHEVAE